MYWKTCQSEVLCEKMATVVLADDETQRIDRCNDENPFGHTKLLTLDSQTCVQTEANNSIGCNEKDPFRDLLCSVSSIR
jgi:hypothetical protein